MPANEELRTDEPMVQRMFRDMYLGRGKNDPPIVTRLDRLEQILGQLISLKWIIIGATIAMIANIIEAHIK